MAGPFRATIRCLILRCSVSLWLRCCWVDVTLLHLKLWAMWLWIHLGNKHKDCQKRKKKPTKNHSPKETLTQRLSSVLAKLKHMLGKMFGGLTDTLKDASYLLVWIWRIIHFVLENLCFSFPRLPLTVLQRKISLLPSVMQRKGQGALQGRTQLLWLEAVFCVGSVIPDFSAEAQLCRK